MQIEALKEGDTTRERKKTLSRNLRRRAHFAAGLPCPVRKEVVNLDLLPPLHQRRRGGVEAVQRQSPIPNRGASHREAGEESRWGKDREAGRSALKSLRPNWIDSLDSDHTSRTLQSPALSRRRPRKFWEGKISKIVPKLLAKDQIRPCNFV